MWPKHEPSARESFSHIDVSFGENPPQTLRCVYSNFELEQHKIINYVIIYIEFQSLIDLILLVWQLVALSYPTETDIISWRARTTSSTLEQYLASHRRCLLSPMTHFCCLADTKCSTTAYSLHLFIPFFLASFPPPFLLFFFLSLSLSVSLSIGTWMGTNKRTFWR